MINTKLQSIIDTKSAIGNAINNKGGTITTNTPFFNYAAEINNISTGSVLTGNATTGDVLNGFTFYNNDANTIRTGTLALTGNATTAQVFSGQTFYSNNAKTRLTGTFVFDGNAATTDVSTGKTFFATNGTKLTGTGSLLESSGNDNSKIMFVNNFNAITNVASVIEDLVIGNFYYTMTSNATGNRFINQLHKSNLVSTGVNSQALGTSTSTRFTAFDNFIYVYSPTLSNTMRKYHPSNLVLAANTPNLESNFIQGFAGYNGHMYGGFAGAKVLKISTSTMAVAVNRVISGGPQSRFVGDGAFVFFDFYFTAQETTNSVKLHEGNLVNSTIASTRLFSGAENHQIYVSNGHIFGLEDGGQNIFKTNTSTLTRTNFAVQNAPQTGFGPALGAIIKGVNGTIITTYGVGNVNYSNGIMVRTHLESNGALLTTSLVNIRTTNNPQFYTTDYLGNIYTRNTILPGSFNNQTGIVQYSTNPRFVNANGVTYYETK
jgi:hypothetical protein